MEEEDEEDERLERAHAKEIITDILAFDEGRPMPQSGGHACNMVVSSTAHQT